MTNKTPGVQKTERLSEEGLQRLERHLRCGSAISKPVMAQWIKRYGEPARELLRHHGRYSKALEHK